MKCHRVITLLQSLGRAFLLTCPAVLLAWVIFLNPFEHEADFAMSDFYTRTANRMIQPKLHPEIVILAVDGLSRDEIADVTAKADFLGANIIGLDVFMNTAMPYDEDVLDALGSCGNLVLPSSLTGADKGSIFTSLPNARYGYVNLDSVREGGVVRSYTLSRNGVKSFASVIAEEDYPQSGLIRYEGIEFEILYPDDLRDNAVQGKTVLVGNLNDFSDCHQTPIGVLPGVLVHAYTARTIMDGCTPRPMATWLIILITLLTGTLILWQHTLIGGDLANLCSRIVQVLLLYVLYILGAALYTKWGWYADFSAPILLAAAVLLLYDVIHGTKELVTLLRNKKQNHKRA